MEKVKNVFSKCGSWLKAHAKIVIAVLVVIIAAVVLVNLIGSPEKRALNKYFKALNSYDSEKIAKSMNIEAAVAWKNAQSSSYDYSSYLDSSSSSSSSKSDKNVVERFDENLDDVDDDDVDSYKDNLDDQYDKDDKGQNKVKLLKIVHVTKAKDNKDLKKVVAKIRVTSKPSKDDDDDDDDEKVWAKDKKFTTVQDTYMTFYVYKGKVIGTGYSY